MSAEERRLAAIMFTDIVGYSALAERDEALAMELLKLHHEMLRPLFPKHRGEEIKTIGDAFLIEFHSALEAVICAIEMQAVMAEYNESADPDRRFKIRIGIHLGDVIHRDGDVYGDGVNIASRIESLAEPGGICISEFFYDQIRKRLDTPLVSMGRKKLKNIEDPIEIYKVVLPWDTNAKARPARVSSKNSGILKWAVAAVGVVGLVMLGLFVSNAFNLNRAAQPELPGNAQIFPTGSPIDGQNTSGPRFDSIAVLPFSNLSADVENEYFSDGLTEELINAFSRVEGLRVISRTSVFTFKGRDDLGTRIIGQQLNVDTILEGSVRKSGDTVRITVQLIDVSVDDHIWSASYDREMKDVFAIQDEIAKSIVDTLKLEFIAQTESSLAFGDTDNVDAYNFYLQGRFFWNKRTKDGFERAIDYFTQATELDPSFARAFAGLADSYSLMASYQHMPQEEAYEQAKTAAETAIRLDDSLAEAHTSLGFITENYLNENESALASYERAIQLKPSYATAHHWYSILLEEMGNMEESITEARLAHELDPLSPIINVNLAFRLMDLNEYDEAKDKFETALEIDPNFPNAYTGLATIRILQKDFQGAEAIMLRYLEVDPDDFQARAGYAIFLSQLGRFEKALGEINNAIDQSDGEDAILLYTALSLINYFAEDYDAAIEAGHEALGFDPDSGNANGTLAGSYFEIGDYDQGVEYNNRSLTAFLPAEQVEAMQQAYEEGGLNGYVGKGIELLKEDSDEPCGQDAYSVAVLEAIAENYETSLDCLYVAYENKSQNLLNIKVHPVLKPLHKEQRFIDLLKEIGFPDS